MKKLVWRLWAISIVQVALLITAVAIVGYLARPKPGDHPNDHGPVGFPDRPPPPDGEFRPMPPHDGPPPGRPPGPHPPHGNIPWPPILTALGFGSVIVLIGAVFTARWIVRPLGRLGDAAKKMGEGDLTARVKLERSDELGELGESFDQMAERLQKLILAEKELMANVSHELRTPLARIRVALDLANEGDAAAARVAISEIGVDLAEMEKLIDDILTSTRLELSHEKPASFGFEVHRETMTPGEIAEKAAERFRATYSDRPLTVTIADDLPDIAVDPVLFRRLLGNLLSNAHKYSDGSVELVVEKAKGGVAFFVSDEGKGIGKEDLERIFMPFFRADPSRSRDTGGLGLGLTLVKRIAEAHGGTVSVTSEMGKGTKFKVFVPSA